MIKENTLKVASRDPKQGIYLNELGQEIYNDCMEVLSNVCDTSSEVTSYKYELVDIFMDGLTEKEIYAWLQRTTELINKGN